MAGGRGGTGRERAASADQADDDGAAAVIRVDALNVDSIKAHQRELAALVAAAAASGATIDVLLLCETKARAHVEVDVIAGELGMYVAARLDRPPGRGEKGGGVAVLVRTGLVAAELPCREARGPGGRLEVEICAARLPAFGLEVDAVYRPPTGPTSATARVLGALSARSVAATARGDAWIGGGDLNIADAGAAQVGSRWERRAAPPQPTELDELVDSEAVTVLSGSLADCGAPGGHLTHVKRW